MKIVYKDFKFKATTLEAIAQANEIITEYSAQGYSLTLRQLYYQFVARDLLANTQKNYHKLGKTLSNARLAGMVSWQAIEDRTRNLKRNYHYEDPREAIQDCINTYKLNMWVNQPNYVEVWIEKDALVGVIERVCRELDVPYFACRGYTSQSEQWRAGKRLEAAVANGKDVTILHLGDHDPSGIDMTRDNEERLSMFSRDFVTVKRLALNYDQVEEYAPPPNPAKATDSRFEKYVQNFGDSCWELDALEPSVISEIVRSNINELTDPDAWQEREEEKAEHVEKLQNIADELDGY